MSKTENTTLPPEDPKAWEAPLPIAFLRKDMREALEHLGEARGLVDDLIAGGDDSMTALDFTDLIRSLYLARLSFESVESGLAKWDVASDEYVPPSEAKGGTS